MATKKVETKAPAKPVTPVTKAQEIATKEGIDPTLFAAGDTDGYYDGMDAGAYSIPFLTILQGLSPACQQGTPAYIPGAQPGMILNTVTKKLMATARVTVLRRSHSICRWIPRELGSGFINEEPAHVENMAAFNKIPLDDKKRRIQVEDGKKVEQTEHRNFWTAVLGDDGRQEPALVSMTKSQLKPARDWNTNIDVYSAKVPVIVQDGSGNKVNALRPVLHSGVWELSTVLKSKDGNNWFVWVVKFLGLHTDRLAITGIREKVQLAKSQDAIARQLEIINEPAEQPSGEM